MQAQTTKFVAYFRVSADRQGKSALGLEAQAEAVARYLASVGGTMIGAYTEVESGKRNQRIELAKALADCKRRKARLVIAKLDRLSRNVAFIAALMDGNIEFTACDNPHATRLTLHILAAVAEHEADMIAKRTSAALQAIKARGVKLGLNGANCLAPAYKAAAIERAARLRGILAELGASGMSNRQIAAALTARGVATPRGGHWHPQTVSRVMERIALNLKPAVAGNALAAISAPQRGIASEAHHGPGLGPFAFSGSRRREPPASACREEPRRDQGRRCRSPTARRPALIRPTVAGLSQGRRPVVDHHRPRIVGGNSEIAANARNRPRKPFPDHEPRPDGKPLWPSKRSTARRVRDLYRAHLDRLGGPHDAVTAAHAFALRSWRSSRRSCAAHAGGETSTRHVDAN